MRIFKAKSEHDGEEYYFLEIVIPNLNELPELADVVDTFARELLGTQKDEFPHYEHEGHVFHKFYAFPPTLTDNQVDALRDLGNEFEKAMMKILPHYVFLKAFKLWNV